MASDAHAVAGDGEEVVVENGISILLKKHHDKPGKCKTFYNPVMKICREFVLCALHAHCQKQEQPIKVLDAFSATGVGGLQWKHHLKEKVIVTLNELDPVPLSEIKENCKRNKISWTDNHPEGNTSPGVTVENQVNDLSVEENGEGQTEGTPSGDGQGKLTNNEVEIVEGSANIIMHLRQFSFIHLDPYGTTVQFLDSAFKNIYNNGIMVVTSTDVASLYGKCPQVTMRNYNAYTLKTDYMKELAARLVLAAIVRAAAKCNKGVRVLYSLAIEHFVQVAVQICRGPGRGDECLTELRHVLHCQMCEEWAMWPQTRAPVEKPYDLLPCECHTQNPGKTAVKLGPVWCGELFDVDFVARMRKSSSELELSERIESLLDIMHGEVICAGSSSPPPAEHKSESAEAGEKRTASADGDSPPKKKACLMRPVDDKKMPPFYYDLHRRKLKSIDLPKSNKLVTLLRREGFRASRTHFEPQAVRTDATLKELTDLLVKFRTMKPQF